jgi:hypothetical protein
MTKPAITKYSVKGSPLTTSELDTNFQNIVDATVSLTAGTGGTAVSTDLNGTITLVAGSGISLSGDNTAKTITITNTGSGGSALSNVVEDTTPQLGGNLDVNGFDITAVSGQPITIAGVGSGSIFISPDTGSLFIDSNIVYVGKEDTDVLVQLNSTTVTKTLTINANNGSGRDANIFLSSDGSLGFSSWGNIDFNEGITRSYLMKSIGYAYTTLAPISGTFTPSTSDGTVQEFTLSGNITINDFASPGSSSADHKKYVILIIKQPSSGGPYTLTSTMKFEGGSKTLSTAANAVDILEIFHTGSQYYATLRKGFA